MGTRDLYLQTHGTEMARRETAAVPLQRYCENLNAVTNTDMFMCMTHDIT